MQKIVSQFPSEILVDSLDGNELVAYRAKDDNGGVCVLSKLNKGNSYGFITLKYSTSHPTFVDEGWFNAVKKAAPQRQLYAFSNMNELIEAIYTNKF